MGSVGRIVIPGFIALFGLASVAGAQNPGRAAGVIGDRLHAGSVLGVGRAPQSSVMDLTLDDAVKRALERNLDIAVEEINPQVQDLTLAEQQAFYRPTLGFNMDNTARTYPASTQLDGGRVTETGTQNLNLSINQPVKWGGGSFSVGLNNMRSETTNFFSSFNPSFRAIFNTTFTQPLLRGFRTDFNRQQLRVTRVNRDIADIDLRQMITNTVTDVRNAYWDLLYASASVGVQQEALDLAEQLVRDNRARVEIGTLAPIEVVNAQAQAAARRGSARRGAPDFAHGGTGAQAPDRGRHGGSDLACHPQSG